ncbi:uncharacterized protein [Atheta coriaria]|uniref:uncharacterized protein isoform X2 n=1 Tax=Dalotia coriaria TaxID=877792 RepID=UPI0031F40825
MSSRRFSRPRTRIYDVNYNIGNSYYQPTIDRLDRKYSGRPMSPAPRQTSVPADLLERHERAFADEDLETARSRAQKRISEANAFDVRSNISRALELVDNDVDEETMNNIKARRIKDRAEQMLDSVGIATIDNTERNKKLNDITYARRAIKVTVDATGGSDANDLVKWTKFDGGMSAAVEDNSAAVLRAKKSRARLNELEDEMTEMAEKAQVRERRAARLRQMVSETSESTEQQTSSVRSSGRQKREAIEY